MNRLALLLVLLFLTGFAVHAQDKLFPPDAVVNITLPPYNAKPQAGTDNTAALQKAITENVDTGRVLYLPEGTYEVSDTLAAKNAAGLWQPHLTLQGQGRDKTILRLIDHAAGFDNAAKPKAILMTGSVQGPGDSPEGGGNKAFRNNIFDLTIDAGTGNPGAIGIEYAVSNQGAIKHVSIRSQDGQGAAGIAMRRKIPGPGLLKNVTITGFDVGIDIGDMQYGITMEDISLQGQKMAGIRNTENVLHIRHLASVNQVPAVLVTKPNGTLLLVDSQLTGGSPDHYAIESFRNLTLRNVTTSGYREAAVRCDGIDLKGPNYGQATQPATLGAVSNSTLLPIEETPEFWNADLTDWTPVGPRLAGEEDDTAAIQRAFDSGKGTIYFPYGRTYFLSDTVAVRGKVRQVLGMGSEISLGAAKIPFSDVEHPRPLVRIDPTDGPIMFFENMFFNAQYPGEVLFENNSPATVVIKHCLAWEGSDGHRHAYRNTNRATGKLFLEDNFLDGWDFTQQTVWARQFNPENPDGNGIEPQVSNVGGKLWILGFKTEGPAPFLATSAGGTTELLGAYNYVSATAAPTVPPAAVPYLITDSTAALTFLSDNFRDNDYTTYIRESRDGAVKDWKGSDLHPRDGAPHCKSFFASLYRSAPWEKGDSTPQQNR